MLSPLRRLGANQSGSAFPLIGCCPVGAGLFGLNPGDICWVFPRLLTPTIPGGKSLSCPIVRPATSAGVRKVLEARLPSAVAQPNRWPLPPVDVSGDPGVFHVRIILKFLDPARLGRVEEVPCLITIEPIPTSRARKPLKCYRERIRSFHPTSFDDFHFIFLSC